MDFTSPAQNGAHATHPKRIFDKPAYKTNKKKLLRTQYMQQSVHTHDKLLNNQSIKASICPFFVQHQWLLHAKLITKPSQALTRCYVTSTG